MRYFCVVEIFLLDHRSCQIVSSKAPRRHSGVRDSAFHEVEIHMEVDGLTSRDDEVYGGRNNARCGADNVLCESLMRQRPGHASCLFRGPIFCVYSCSCILNVRAARK